MRNFFLDKEPDGDDLSTIALDNLSISAGSTEMKTLSLASVREESADKNVECTFVHEGAYTNIYCFHDPENKMGSRTCYVAIKKLNEMCSDDDHSSRLRNECTISGQLVPRCSAVRATLGQAKFEGLPALFLEWIPGMTLRKWIDMLQMKRGSRSFSRISHSGIIMEDMKATLQLACTISKAFADIHDAGVIHNNISADNIIVDNTNDSACMLVKVIGLGSASLVTDIMEIPSKIRGDIISLGSILFHMFTGKCPIKSENDFALFASSLEIRGGIMLSQNQLISTLMDTTPSEISVLILDLMEADGSLTSYKSARDVERKLNELSSSLKSIISNYDPRRGLGHLQIRPGKLYGHDSQISELTNACSTIGAPGASKMVMISGFSGVGKSAVVEHVKANLKHKKMHFISGKFDQHTHTEPLYAINAAVADFTNNVIRQGPQSIFGTKIAILDSIKTEIGVLTGAFPCLCEIVGKPTTTPTDVGSMAAQNRFKFIFQIFVRAITTPSCPIILFLDDLQWADKLSFELITTLITDAEINDFLFIGSYRDNEIDATHSLSVMLNDLKTENVSVTNISVGSISKEDVNNMILDAISTQQHMTKSLSDIVYKKTSGNALFVAHYLELLWNEGLLFFSLELNTWQWDSDTIKAKEILDDVGVLLSRKILQLPIECQCVIKQLACIGAKCNVSILKMFMGKVESIQMLLIAQDRKKNASGDNWLLMLDFAVDEGLLKKEGPNYAFAHDQIQHAAYSIIPENDRGHIHKHIGELILKHMTDDNCDALLFIIVDQLNRGQQSMMEKDTRLELAMLNLRAGEKAMSLATFLSSASYLKVGIDLLCDGHWEECYNLSLQLYSLYAEAEYCNGHFQEVGHASDVVMEQAKSFEDKLRVYATCIKSLAAQNKLNDAIEIGFSVLSQLGVQCPSPPSDESVGMRGIMETAQILKDKTISEFLRYPEMDDSKIIAAMKFLRILLLYTFLAKPQYFPIIVIQMMQLTIRHGVCKESCVPLAFLSFMMCEFNDFDTSDHIGRLAIRLLEKIGAEEYLSQVYLYYYGDITCWKAHIKQSLQKQLHGYKLGMQTGDIENAMWNAYLYLTNSFISGQSLIELERKLDLFGKQMIQYKQNVTAHLIRVIHQLVSNLVNSTDTFSLMVGQEEEQKVLLSQATKKEYGKVVAFLYMICGIEAYMFGKYEFAAEMVQSRQQVEKEMPMKNIFYGSTPFYDGLIFLAMAHKTSDIKWISAAGKEILKLESFVQTGKVNCEHKLLLLQAEANSLSGQKDDASSKYELAIAAAERNDFIHEHAITHERAGDFLLRNGDARASQHYGKAHVLYLRWGARGKADHLAKTIPF